jgi:hypothetical protein
MPEVPVTTRRLRLALWQHQEHLKGQASAQESAATHLIGLADTLNMVGRPEAAQYLVRVALRFRVKAICLSAQAAAVDWNTGQFIHETASSRNRKGSQTSRH